MKKLERFIPRVIWSSKKKKMKHANKCYWPSIPRALLHYQIWSSEKKIGWAYRYHFSTHFDVKNFVSILMTSLKGLTSL